MLLREHGFPIHNEKSVLIPSQVLSFLEFVLNSIMMTVQLTDSQKKKLKNACLTLVNREKCTVQSVAEVTRLIVSSLSNLLMHSLQTEVIFSFMLSLLLASWGNAWKKIKQTKQREYWWCHYGPAKVGTQNC